MPLSIYPFHKKMCWAGSHTSTQQQAGCCLCQRLTYAGNFFTLLVFLQQGQVARFGLSTYIVSHTAFRLLFAGGPRIERAMEIRPNSLGTQNHCFHMPACARTHSLSLHRLAHLHPFDLLSNSGRSPFHASASHLSKACHRKAAEAINMSPGQRSCCHGVPNWKPCIGCPKSRMKAPATRCFDQCTHQPAPSPAPWRLGKRFTPPALETMRGSLPQ